MRRALECAAAAAAQGEVPVGAVVVRHGVEIASAFNAVEGACDAMAHAEVLALKRAQEAVGDWRLTDCTLYVSKEPCAMCAGAAVNCRLGTLVFGVGDPRMGAAGGSAIDVVRFPGMLHHMEVRGGVLAEECRTLLQEFFRQRRSEANAAK